MDWNLSMKNQQLTSIPFFNFDAAPNKLKKRWVKSVDSVIQSNHYVLGKTLRDFETNFAEYLQVKNVVGVGNGLDALEIGLKSLGIGPGSIVAVPTHTFIATWLAVNRVGATVIPVAIDNNGLIDIGCLETSHTKIDAIIPVHMHGNMVDMPRLLKWSRKSDVKVIEDCAQAHGASIAGKKAGTWGDVGCYSFYPTKNLGALGDAGAFVSNSQVLIDFALSYRSYGSNPENKYDHQTMGVNSRLDDIQAGFLEINLMYLDEWNLYRRFLANEYANAFRGKLDHISGQSESVYHHFIVFLKNRSSARQFLESRGIYTEIHYPNSPMDLFQKRKKVIDNNLGFDMKFSDSGLSIPLNQWLSHKDLKRIIRTMTDEAFLKEFSTL